MSVLKASFVIGGSIILSSALSNIDSLSELSTNGNVIKLENGSVKLGTVYEENLITYYEITDNTTGQKLLSVTSPTSQIYNEACSKIKENIDLINNAGGITNSDGKKEKLDLSWAAWTNPVTVTKITTVTYRSKYNNNFVLNIDDSKDVIQPKTRKSQDIIDDLKAYSKKMDELFRTKHDLIK